MKSGFIDKLIDRLDRLDAGSLQNQFLRLARDKGFLETIFHAIQEGILVIDGEGRVVYTNRAAEKLLDLPERSIVGRPITQVVRDIEWGLVLDLDEGEWSRLVSREIEITYPHHRFLDLYVVPLAAVSKGETGAAVILRDVTRDREQEVKVIESERLHAITLLAAGVAHEIGNPLNSLNIHLQLMAREVRSLPEESRKALDELLDVARQEVSRLDQIITQFLRAIRPSQPTLKPDSVLDVLKETLVFLKHEIRDRDILVELDAPETVPDIPLDRAQIKQAVFNIVRNALQAMSAGGLLKISVAVSDRHVAVAFKDTGPGISAEDMGHLFEPYRTTKAEGTGLGLMIVQRIVRDHGGQIEIHSEPQSGATFTIFLPRDENRIRLLKAHRSETSREEP